MAPPALNELVPPSPVTRPVHDRIVERCIVHRLELVVVNGPQEGETYATETERCAVGTNASNDLVVTDPTTSQFHCEIYIGDTAAPRVRDLGSRNGTYLDGVRVVEAFVRTGSVLRLGETEIMVRLAGYRNVLPLSGRCRLGSLVGSSVSMRRAFAALERAVNSACTVLLEGETGTGKELAAEALHTLGARSGGPLVVVDCGALPAGLIESHLFGHERGAFTGASDLRVGAFEAATGGTIFLDEIGELPLALQPKLLRVIEAREIRRVGGSNAIPIDVRVVAATNRDLRAEVNAGRFREDLYHRLAVVRVCMPALRSRPEDLPLLVEEVLATLDVDPDRAAPLRTPEFLARLSRSAWPGNVRELRNHLQRCLAFGEALEPTESLSPEPSTAALPLDYAAARAAAQRDFERRYLEQLLARIPAVAAAARAAGLSKRYLYQMLERHPSLRRPA